MHAGNCSCSQGTRWISQPQSHKCTAHTTQALAYSGLHPATISPGVPSQGGLHADSGIHHLLMQGHTCNPRTYSQPGSSVTWVHSGLSHMVPCSGTQAGTHSYRVTHKRTQSHGHTQSHGRTQAHTQAHTPAGHTCSATSCCWLFRPPCLHANSCP